MEEKKTTEIIAGTMGMIQETHLHRRHAQKKCLDTRRRVHDLIQWEDHKK